MNIELKRDHFACSIRQQQREKYRKEQRNSLIKMGQLPLTHKNALNYDLYEEVK